MKSWSGEKAASSSRLLGGLPRFLGETLQFHFAADGKLIRRIKRFISNEATNSIRVVWKEWEIGSGVSAEALLESAKDE